MTEFKCLICGMKINTKNYHINENSFIEKNKEDDILCCPFCGVSRQYISSEGEIYKINTLCDNTKKILDSAMKLEVFNGEFYLEAYRLAKAEELKKMFKDLSSVEFFHARVHQRLGGFQELPKLHRPDYSKHDTDELLLQEAFKREAHAVHFYDRYMERIADQPLRIVLTSLSEVEKQHMNILK